MDSSRPTITTEHKVRWEKHETLLKIWKHHPPVHPVSPRYRAIDFSVEGRYSFVESIVNIFRDKGWLDAPPADFKWAIITVYYRAPKDAREHFDRLSTREPEEASAPRYQEVVPDESNEWDTVGV
ncbi:MAG TPA: hypothetical protein VFT74_11935 [Isosphaeraceae bacterium]|nr:hypothetical protein [Isosphaeraceae bacterium]